LNNAKNLQKLKTLPEKKLHSSESLPWEPLKSPWWQKLTSNQCFNFRRENAFLTTVKKRDYAKFHFFQLQGLIAQNVFPRSPFLKCWGVRGIKACKKISFFNAKIVRCPSCGYYKKGNFFKKFFSKQIDTSFRIIL
jgi:hypothetical protein